MGIKIKTKPFGEIEVHEKQIVSFPDGILGFDFVKKFAVLDTDKEKSPFKWLQAVDEPDLAFIVIRPMDFMSDYRLNVSQHDLEAIGSAGPGDLLVFAIVTIPSNPAEMTANLQGPVIINIARQIGRQAITLDDRYSVRQSIIGEIRKASEGKG